MTEELEEKKPTKKTNALQEDFDKLKEMHDEFLQLPREHKLYASEEKRVQKLYDKIAKKLKKDKFSFEVLSWADLRGLVSLTDLEKLSEYEALNLADGKAELIAKLPSGAYRLKVGDEVSYFKSFDKQRRDYVYTFFVKFQHRRQGTKTDYMKVARNEMSMAELPHEGRVEYKRFRLVSREFNRYFKELDD